MSETTNKTTNNRKPFTQWLDDHTLTSEVIRLQKGINANKGILNETLVCHGGDFTKKDRELIEHLVECTKLYEKKIQDYFNDYINELSEELDTTDKLYELKKLDDLVKDNCK